MKYRPLDPLEEASLRAFVREYGRSWRLQLAILWLTGSVELDKFEGLYKLRNTHGTDWLHTYDIKEKNDEQGS